MARTWRCLQALTLVLLFITPYSVISQGYDGDLPVEEVEIYDREEDPEDRGVNSADEAFPTNCNPPVPPENGYIEGTETKLGSQVTLKCNPGFYLVGTSTMRCLAVPGLARKLIWDPQDQYYCEEREVVQAPQIQELFDDEEGDPEENELVHKDSLNGVEIEQEEEEKEEEVEEASNRPDDSEFFEEPVMLQGSESRKENPSKMTELPELCSYPKVEGPCKASFPRYYYNMETGDCQLFTYGGCRGNKNRFKTVEDCEETCVQ
ncbi:amyloid-like protein 2 [Lingula anatina]|uniref:Amyloid-like protein 2 n=1 Tax=Lingula anatina TaxID=7574 RepID=A0A1S3I3K0_LINAN|nr:amyloid-like protein 2 [Lingula anatina]|eukprot:XP_013392411.1 amyloid-like protein 2 [Lingula anatina]